MNDPLELKTIRDSLLENETNIDAAARMAAVFPHAQRHVIVPVLDELEAKLRVALGPDWEIYNSKEEILSANYPGFTVSRKAWGEIYVNLENGTREGETVIGIWRERKPESAAMDTALVEAFAKAKLAGSAPRFWAWYRLLPPERGNWNAAPALAAMHFHRTEFVDYLLTEILQVQKLATPILDRFLTKKA